MAVHNLWTHSDLGVYNDQITAPLDSHACSFVKLTPANSLH
jgi:hypothetical protein